MFNFTKLMPVLLAGTLLLSPMVAFADGEDVPTNTDDQADTSSLEPTIDPQQSDTNTCLINVSASVPDDFKTQTDNNLFVQITNQESTASYQIQMLAENHYAGYGYVPADTYSIDLIDAYKDDNNEFTFTYPDEKTFTVSGTDTYTINTSLQEGDKKDTADAASASKASSSSSSAASSSTTSSSEDLGQPDAENGTLTWRAIEGNAMGLVSYTGVSNGKYNFNIKIAHSGKLGEATFKISYDNGETYSDQTYKTAKDVPLVNKDGQPTGLTLHFKEGDYAIDTTYTFSTEHEYKVLHKGDGQGIISIYGETSTGGTLTLEIMNSGVPGTATFHLSQDGGKTWGDETVIPAEGVYTPGAVTIRFSQDEFKHGDRYTSVIPATVEEDHTPIIVGIAAGVIVAILFIMIGLLKRKSKTKEVYEIMR